MSYCLCLTLQGVCVRFARVLFGWFGFVCFIVGGVHQVFGCCFEVFLVDFLPSLLKHFYLNLRAVLRFLF